MKNSLFLLCTVLTLLSTLGSVRTVYAQPVTLQQNGMTLNANLELADGNTIGNDMILILHGALAHGRMELISYLQNLLKERGYNSLAITLSLGVDQRHGMYDCRQTHRHRHEDALDEIDAWLNWLQQQGSGRVTLLGHSRGGTQVALYLAERKHPLPRNAVLMAPSTRLNAGAGYQQRYQQDLGPSLATAQQLVRQGKGDTVIEHSNLLHCRDTRVSADSFVSYYGQDERADTPDLLAKIALPVLVIIAGDDRIVTDLKARLTSTQPGKHHRVAIVEGSGHFFRDLNSDDAADLIDSYLQDASNQP